MRLRPLVHRQITDPPRPARGRAAPPRRMDPFDVFGIPPGFDLDPAALERRQRELARVVHPDRVAQTGAVERRRALARAVDVNEAHRVLRDPARRAEALLRRLGAPVGELDGPKAPPHLLLEMMEQREALSDAQAKGDLAAFGRLEAWARGREAEVLAALSAGFARALAAAGAGEAAPGAARGAAGAGEAAPGAARGTAGAGEAAGGAGQGASELAGRLGELRYVRRFLDEVRAIEEDFASRAEGARGA